MVFCWNIRKEISEYFHLSKFLTISVASPGGYFSDRIEETQEENSGFLWGTQKHQMTNNKGPDSIQIVLHLHYTTIWFILLPKHTLKGFPR